MKNTKSIAITALYVALVAIMNFLPNMVGFLTPIVKFNLALLPIVVCAHTTDLKTAFFVSTAYGICSLINNYIAPTMLSFTFQNPLVSVVARMPIGIVAFFSAKGLKKLFSKSKNKFLSDVLPYSVSAGLATATNTSCVFAMWLLLYSGTPLANGGVMGLPFLATVLGTNTLIEFIISVVCVPPLSIGVMRAISKQAEKKNVPEYKG